MTKSEVAAFLAGNAISIFETVEKSMRTMAVLFLLASAAISQAKDNGQYSDVSPDIRSWIDGLTNKHRTPCCATADGSVPDAWEKRKDHYRVKIDGVWYGVPDAALVEGPNRLGHAMVWWIDEAVEDVDAVMIRCFLPGPES